MKKFILALLIALSVSKMIRVLEEETKDLQNGLTASETEKKTIANLTIAEKFKNMATNFCDGFNKISSTFKVTQSETVKKFITRDGFSKIKLKSYLFITKNLIESKYMYYMEKRGRSLKIKEDDFEQYKITVEMMPFSDSNSMFISDLVYKDSKDPNSYSSFNVMASMGSKDDTYDVLIHYFKIFEFQLADDILWTEKNSNYFNMFDKTKQNFVKVPKNLSRKEIEALIDFYKVLSLKFIGDSFGINLKLPNLQ